MARVWRRNRCGAEERAAGWNDTFISHRDACMATITDARRPWEPPVVVSLPRLTELTLATSVPGVGEGPGFGGGSVVIP